MKKLASSPRGLSLTLLAPVGMTMISAIACSSPDAPTAQDSEPVNTPCGAAGATQGAGGAAGAAGAGGRTSTGGAAGGTSTGGGTGGPSGGPGCGLAHAAFCETFDAPAGVGNRSGQLNGTVWGASRVTGNRNWSSPADGWAPTQIDACGATKAVEPPNDIAVCGGHLVEAVSDAGTVTSLAMYPKQPFDIAGRTGTFVFDVSDNSQGEHGAWPEIWYTDKPVPDPFVHNDSWASVPKDGMAIRFAGQCSPGQGCGDCPGTAPYERTGVSSGLVVNNYAIRDLGDKIEKIDCVAASTSPDELNHFEMHIAQNQIEIYGTDAGTTAPLKKIAVVHDPNLTLTRGLMWIEDAHYNANKFGTQGTNTFAWDNVGFDGPVLPRDLAFDVNDSLTSGNDGSIELGWEIDASQSRPFSIANVHDVSKASAALLTFNFAPQDESQAALSYSINGHATHAAGWPYPDRNGPSWRTTALPVPLSEVISGTNKITISGGPTSLLVANIDLILVGAGGTP